MVRTTPPRSRAIRARSTPNNKYLAPDTWTPDPVVATYLDRFFAWPESRGIPVFWLIPPMVPALQARHHEQAGIDVAYTRFARRVQERFPNLVVIDGRYASYPPSVFIDPTHLDCQGAAVFSDDLAPIIGRHLALPIGSALGFLAAFRERPPGIALEDVEQSARAIAAATETILCAEAEAGPDKKPGDF